MASADKPSKNLWIAAGAIITVLAVGFSLIFSYANDQRDKSLKSWYDRMELVSESRAAAVSAWLNRHLNLVEEMSKNATLGMYAGEIAVYGESEQRGYTYNFLRTEATRANFHDSSLLDQVAANVNRPRRAGLGIISTSGKTLLQTAGMPALDPAFLATATAKGRASFIDFRMVDKMPVVVMGSRIKVIDGMEAGDNPLWLVGARALKADFYDLLIQPGDSSKTGENYLVMQAVQPDASSETIIPLSPLRDGGSIGRALSDAAASFALSRPGASGQEVNYAGKTVLVTARELTAPVPWYVVRTVTAKEALKDLTEDRNSLILNLSLSAVALVIMMVLVWRLGVSARLQSAYDTQRKLSQENRDLSQFLQDVSDSLPVAIAAISREKLITFANKRLGTLTHLPATELTGRQLKTAFTADEAQTITPIVDSAFNGASGSQLMTMQGDTGPLTMQMESLPLKRGDKEQDQALLVLQDISQLVIAQETAEQNLRQLVSALTRIIDARDPWSKFHSSRVAEVAPAIAEEMNLQGSESETVRTAGQLMNLGKIFVPTEVLTKQGNLSEMELSMVRDSMEKGADLLTGLEFGGPVEAALRQVREHVDGSGSPDHLSADQIIIEAKILSVANAFVGMVSSRSHRAGFDFDKALDILHSESGSKFDRGVVAALQNIIANKGGKQLWASYGDKAKDV